MRETLDSFAGDYHWYKIRRSEYAKEAPRGVSFRVSPEPFTLTPEQEKEVVALGQEVTQFIHAAHELYRRNEDVRNLLNTGKPEIFCVDHDFQYLFVRPDLIVTPDGFSLCEIETSPFGLALAQLLTQAYEHEGHDVMVGSDILPAHVRAGTPADGTLVYSQKTSSYAGQISFLADRVFSGDAFGRSWQAKHVDDLNGDALGNIYRAFYQSEYFTDSRVRTLIDDAFSVPGRMVLPSLTPHLEEKALLALLWDTRCESFLKGQLGIATFEHLRKVVPPTWVVGQEKYFSPGMPSGVTASVDLAKLSGSKRAFVLKSSGFDDRSSWAEGVSFLQKQSHAQAFQLLHNAQTNGRSLSVIQQFRKPESFPMTYEVDGGLRAMSGRVRLTPYFAMGGKNEGEMITVKATACENTDFIHAGTGSINTAVSKAAKIR